MEKQLKIWTISLPYSRNVHDIMHMENVSLMALIPFSLLVLAVNFQYNGFDVWWVSHFYDFQNHIWLYKHHWFFDGIIHTGGQWFDRIIMLIWLVALILSYFQQGFERYRKSLLYFLCATTLGPLLVGVGKQLTHMYTPWDLQMFDGKELHIRLLDHVPAGAPIGHAFPAGHASGAYCFFSLYFVLLYYRSPYRFFCFVFAIFLGLVFGLGQQIRGAHFPSHDMFTLAICWYAAMAVYFLFYPSEWNRLRQHSNT